MIVSSSGPWGGGPGLQSLASFVKRFKQMSCVRLVTDGSASAACSSLVRSRVNPVQLSCFLEQCMRGEAFEPSLSKEFSGEPWNRKQIKAMEGSSGFGALLQTVVCGPGEVPKCCSSETSVCPCGHRSDLWMLLLSHCHAAGLAELNLKGPDLSTSSPSPTIPHPSKLARRLLQRWVASLFQGNFLSVFQIYDYGCAGSFVAVGFS